MLNRPTMPMLQPPSSAGESFRPNSESPMPLSEM